MRKQIKEFIDMVHKDLSDTISICLNLINQQSILKHLGCLKSLFYWQDAVIYITKTIIPKRY